MKKMYKKVLFFVLMLCVSLGFQVTNGDILYASVEPRSKVARILVGQYYDTRGIDVCSGTSNPYSCWLLKSEVTKSVTYSHTIRQTGLCQVYDTDTPNVVYVRFQWNVDGTNIYY